MCCYMLTIFTLFAPLLQSFLLLSPLGHQHTKDWKLAAANEQSQSRRSKRTMKSNHWVNWIINLWVTRYDFHSLSRLILIYPLSMLRVGWLACKLIMLCLVCHPYNAHSNVSARSWAAWGNMARYIQAPSSSQTLPTVISILMSHRRHPTVFILEIERLMRCSYRP